MDLHPSTRTRTDADTAPSGAPRSRRLARRLARLLGGSLAAAGMTAGLMGLAAPASADVLTPGSIPVHSAAICDSGSHSLRVLVSPDPGATAVIHLHSWATGEYFATPRLAPRADSDVGYRIYEATAPAPGTYDVYVEYWWVDANGTELVVGEWISEYYSVDGSATLSCSM
jgi:hypothetical protein